MSIISYKKSPIKYETYEKHTEVVVKKKPVTLGVVVSGLKNDLISLLVKSKIAGLLIPFLLIMFGFNIIFNQLWPDIEQKIKISQGYYDQEPVPLVAGDYYQQVQYLSNPGSAYFKTIATTATTQHSLLDDPISNNYKGQFTISIPSLDLNNLPVTANVDSTQEAVYRKALLNALAHFKGTGLPVSNVNNNIVIYGHSSSGDYFERTHDIAGAFSRLNKIQIGDIVTIQMDGKIYDYRVAKSKIVEPYNTEIISGTPGKRTLTLFTCFPNGNNSQRFVAVANPVS